MSPRGERMKNWEIVVADMGAVAGEERGDKENRSKWVDNPDTAQRRPKDTGGGTRYIKVPYGTVYCSKYNQLSTIEMSTR